MTGSHRRIANPSSEPNDTAVVEYHGAPFSRINELHHEQDTTLMKNILKPTSPLSDAQLERCMRICPDVVIRLAFVNLTASQQAAVAIDHPELILRHAGSNASADCLRSCASAAPCAAMAVRAKFPSGVRPILLARSFAFCWQGHFGYPDPELHREILESLFTDPDEWLLAHNGSFPAIVNRLWKHHKLALLPRYLTQLLAAMPFQQEAIVSSVAPSI